MNRLAQSFFYLICIYFVFIHQERSVGANEHDKHCFTSNGNRGICKTQLQCLISSRSGSGSASDVSKNESFLETCHIENDGTPVICCVSSESNLKEKLATSATTETKGKAENARNNDTNYGEQRVPQQPQFTWSLDKEYDENNVTNNNGSDLESRFFNGPRKRQYYNAVTPPYKTATYNKYFSHSQQYEPIAYNDVYTIPNVYLQSQPPYNTNSNNRVNLYSGTSYPSQGSQAPHSSFESRPISNTNHNFNIDYSYTPRVKGETPPASAYNRLSTEGTILFKPTGAEKVNNNQWTATNRVDFDNKRWSTLQSTPRRRPDEHPVWGEVPESTSTTRTIRTPRPNVPHNPNIYTNSHTSGSGNIDNNANVNTNTDVTGITQHQQQKRVSEQKCNEYAKVVTQSVSAVPLSINSQVSTVQVQDCPKDAVELIVGGKKANLGEFPHMAALGFRRGSSIEYSCGGTLISEDYVLTAAHCIKSALGDPIHVRLGDLNLEKDDDGAEPQVIGVQEIFVHPRYKHPQLYHDIAVIKMIRKVHFNKMLRPACLYPVYNISAPKAIATGWGSTNYGETSSDDLLKVVLNIIDNRQCTSLYGTDAKLKNGIIDEMLCAGELSGKRDTCQGDSGGPLQITSPTHNCVHYVIGITSFGRSCGVPNSAGIYTRVSQYIDWIESVVWK